MNTNFENDYDEYYIRGSIIPYRFLQEHDKGHRPIQHIEKDYLKDLKLNVSMRFFKWYLEKHCKFCDCEPCGCDKGSCNCENNDEIYDPDIMKVNFYDIVACSEQLKKEDINILKQEYKNDINKENSQKNISNEYFYAKIEYFISSTRMERKRYEDYAIVYRDWAYIKHSGKNSKVKIKAEPSRYNAKILNQYYRRPEEMSKNKVENIINKLLKSNPNIKLAKPPKS